MGVQCHTCTQLQSWSRRTERVNDRGRNFGRGRNQSVVYCTCLIVWYKTCTQLQLWARKGERVKRPWPKIWPWPQPECSVLHLSNLIRVNPRLCRGTPKV